MIETRFVRQTDIVPSDIHEKTIRVIGCGAIGRQVAQMAAALGPSKLTLIDFDTVEDHNRTTQGYKIQDIGLLKVDCLKSHIEELYNDVSIEVIKMKYPDKDIFVPEDDIIFCCVDNIAARRRIERELKEEMFEFFCDGRMLAENMRVIAYPWDDFAEYKGTLFSDDREQRGACTGRMTLYSASVCAGIMISKLVRWLREERFLADAMLSLPSESYGELTEGFVD